MTIIFATHAILTMVILPMVGTMAALDEEEVITSYPRKEQGIESTIIFVFLI